MNSVFVNDYAATDIIKVLQMKYNWVYPVAQSNVVYIYMELHFTVHMRERGLVVHICRIL